MQSDHVAVEVGNKRDEAVLADRELLLHDLAAVGRNPLSFHSTVITGEIDDGSVTARLFTFHAGKRSRGAGRFLLHRKGPHSTDSRVWAFEPSQLSGQYSFIKCAGTCKILYVDLEPTDWIDFHVFLA